MWSPFPSSAPVFGSPLNVLGVDPDLSLGDGLVVFLYGFVRETEDVLAPVVVH